MARAPPVLYQQNVHHIDKWAPFRRIIRCRQQQAAAALEQAVGANFAVRDTPLYAIVHAKLLLASNRAEEARKLLETAMTLPGVRTGNAAVARSRGQRPLALPTLSERATIYLLLAEAQSKVAKSPNAPEVTKIIQAAVDEFRGTSEEVRRRACCAFENHVVCCEGGLKAVVGVLTFMQLCCR